MPKVWTETIETHRRAVRDAILDTTAALASSDGPLYVTMSQIAEEVGIGRATLYKYFPDVESILVEWHKRQIAGHLERLIQARDQADDPYARLSAVLEALALTHYEQSGIALAAVLRDDDHLADETQRIKDLLSDLLVQASAAGQLRTTIAPGELANYCFHALSAASTSRSKAAARRLVGVVLAGIEMSN